MSSVTPVLKLDKNAGNLANLHADAQLAAQDANLDKLMPLWGKLVATEEHSSSGAIAIKQGTVFIAAASAAALTLGAPTAGARIAGGDDGKVLKIIATTARAHTVTTPPDSINGAGDTITFAAVADEAKLVAFGGVCDRDRKFQIEIFQKERKNEKRIKGIEAEPFGPRGIRKSVAES